MRLRTSKTLKIFIILLFSFEMMAPAFINAEPEPTGARTYVIHTSHFNNCINFLLMEENSSEEEKDDRDHKPLMGFTDLGFIVTFLEMADAGSQTIHFTPIHERVGSQPPLFTLHRTFLI